LFLQGVELGHGAIGLGVSGRQGYRRPTAATLFGFAPPGVSASAMAVVVGVLAAVLFEWLKRVDWVRKALGGT
jgi:hypothetical protein